MKLFNRPLVQLQLLGLALSAIDRAAIGRDDDHLLFILGLMLLVSGLGALLGVAGLPLPVVEVGIAAPALVLGALVAFAVRPPLLIAALVVTAFAIWHGHAHGTELPEAVNPLAYGTADSC